MSASGEPMKTIGGMSVRAEIDARLDAVANDTRAATIDECIAFLGASGHLQAAEDLRIAAFDAPNPSTPPTSL